MIEILTAATVLTAVIMGIRKYTIGRISMRFRYALWLLVALRLILPVSPGNNPYSILNLVSDWSGVNVISRQLANDADGSLETGSDRASGKMEYGMPEDGKLYMAPDLDSELGCVGTDSRPEYYASC